MFNMKILFAGLLTFVLLLLGGNIYLHLDPKSIISPINQLKKISFAGNIWFPKQNNFNVLGAEVFPEITAQAYFFVDLQTGEILYEKNSHQKLSIASLV